MRFRSPNTVTGFGAALAAALLVAAGTPAAAGAPAAAVAPTAAGAPAATAASAPFVPLIAPVYGYEVVNVYPHDPAAYTEGLLYERGFLYEGTGIWGESDLRKVELETGNILKQRDLPAEVFGEGVAVFQDSIYQITWQDSVGYTCVERDTFELGRTFAYPREGWGLTSDGVRLIASDGSNVLRFLNPHTMAVISEVPVFDGANPVVYLNELEQVQGRIYANVLTQDRIAVIHPATGRVEAWIDLGGLRDSVSAARNAVDMNGIAFDPATRRLFVTGKWWPKLFEIDVVLLHPEDVPDGAPDNPRADPAALAPALGLRVFPNPTRGRIHLVITGAGDRPRLVEVFDPHGRRIGAVSGRRSGVGEQEADLDLGDFAAGVYFVWIPGGGAGALRKVFVVQ